MNGIYGFINRKCFTRKLFLVGVLVFSIPSAVFAADPSLDWREINTEHFHIVYESRLAPLARRYARYAETAHGTLKPLFKTLPQKTTIVLDDSTDFANGFATVFPYPLITAYPSLPTSLDSISYYGNWGYELLLHEYVHVAHTYPVRGVYTPFRYLFGSLVSPNLLLPKWQLEGLAVYLESSRTEFGRLRSPGYEANIRAMVEAGSLKKETIDQINEVGTPTFPLGERPYMLGGYLWQEMILSDKESLIGYLTDRYSSRVPYFLGGPAEDRLGKTYESLLAETYEKLERRAQRQVGEIEKAKVSRLKVLDDKGLRIFSPAVSPDGKKLIYLAAVPKKPGEVRLRTRGEGGWQKPERLFRARGLQSLSWMPDSEAFVFEQAVRQNHYAVYRDLFLHDLKSGESRRLTRDERAAQPSVSRDGQEVVYLSQDGARQHLRILNLTDGKSRTLFKGSIEGRLSDPVFYKSFVYFVERSLRGKASLKFIPHDGGQASLVNLEQREISQLKATPLGVLAVSSHTGVPNVYRYVEGEDLQPLTNLVTAAMTPEWDATTKELIFSNLSARGYHLVSQGSETSLNPPHVAPLYTMDSPGRLTFVKTPGVKEKEFSSWRYMYPRYWSPFIYPVDGGVIFQGTTEAGDPLGRNYYLLEASYDTITEKLSYGFSYSNRSFSNFGSTWAYAEYQDYLPGYELTLTHRAGGAALDAFLSRDNSFIASAGLSYAETDTLDLLYRRQGPTVSLAYVPDRLSSDEVEGGKKDEDASQESYRLSHTEYVKSENFLNYGKSQFAVTSVFRRFLPEDQSILAQIKGSFAPDLPIQDVVVLGDKSIGGNYVASLITSSFLMRGYPSAAFVGRKLVNVNLEYRFPVADVYEGRGHLPLFLQSVSGAVFTDSMAVDGGYFDEDAGGYVRSELNKTFSSAGVELRADTTFSYHFPLRFVLGLYYGFDPKAGGGFTPFFSFGFSGSSEISSRSTRH